MDMLVGARGRNACNISIAARKLVKVSHAAGEMVTVFSVTLFLITVRDAGKTVGQGGPTGKGGRQEQRGTYYLRPTNLSQKWRASEALFWEYHRLCLSQSYK